MLESENSLLISQCTGLLSKIDIYETGTLLPSESALKAIMLLNQRELPLLLKHVNETKQHCRMAKEFRNIEALESIESNLEKLDDAKVQRRIAQKKLHGITEQKVLKSFWGWITGKTKSEIVSNAAAIEVSNKESLELQRKSIEEMRLNFEVGIRLDLFTEYLCELGAKISIEMCLRRTIFGRIRYVLTQINPKKPKSTFKSMLNNEVSPFLLPQVDEARL